MHPYQLQTKRTPSGKYLGLAVLNGKTIAISRTAHDDCEKALSDVEQVLKDKRFDRLTVSSWSILTQIGSKS
jgi:hypothetical protein